jgi:transcriptional regulator with XRE-family HTH domain
LIKFWESQSMPLTPQAFSKRFKEAREAKGITPSELARRVGVTPAAVWNWENNLVTPRRPALEAVAKALGVTPDFLLTGRAQRESVESPVTQDVPAILHEARVRLARATGLPIDRIKLNLQFTSE